MLKYEKAFYICTRNQGILDETLGELAEWSNAAVLKTVEGYTSGGSNPSFSAKENPQRKLWVFCFQKNAQAFRLKAFLENEKQGHAFWSGVGFSLPMIPRNGISDI